MFSEEWRHPTMADDGVRGPVRCRCGRAKQPGEMLDVRGLGVGATYLCGPCVDDLLRTGKTDHLTLHERAGAPPAWLAAFRVKLLGGPLRRAGLPRDIWGEILARELDAAAAVAVAEAPPIG